MDSHDTIYLIDNDDDTAELIESQLYTGGYAALRFVSSGAFMDEVSISETGCVISNAVTSGNICLEVQKELLWRGSDLTIICICTRCAAPINGRPGRYSPIITLELPFTGEELVKAVTDGIAKSHLRLANRRRLENVERRLAQLTESEQSVLRCLMRGLSHKNIASQLEISSRSVDRRRASILEKMEVETIQELIGMLAELRFDS